MMLIAAMIESLRAYGYTLNTAVADLIDNSISADSKNIWINLEWNGESSRISILDDGTGMDERRNSGLPLAIVADAE